MSVNYVDILVSNTEKRKEQDKKFDWWLYPFLTIVLMFVLLIVVWALVMYFNLDIFNSGILDLEFLNIIATGFLLMIVGLIGFIFICFHLMYKRAKRVNFFIQRKKEWYETISEFTINSCKNSESLGKLEDFINEEVNMPPKKINYTYLIIIAVLFIPYYFLKIEDSLYRALPLLVIFILEYLFLYQRVQNPIMSLSIKNMGFLMLISVLAVILMGDVLGNTINNVAWIMILAIYSMPINYLWNKLQKREYRFCDLINNIWIEEGWMTEKIEFFVDPRKHRSMREWTFLSVITGGIGFLVWDYKIHTDPDSMYPRFYKAEDEILEIIKKQSALQLESQE
jgi:hypothetical protein